MSIDIKTLYGQDNKTAMGVEARVPRLMDEWRFNEPLRNISVLQRMRNAGAPMIGAISITGVEHGKLEMWFEDDLDGGVFVYRWTGTLVKPAPRSTCEFQNKAKVPEDDDL